MFCIKKINSSLLSFVVQGSVEDKSIVDKTLRSIRYFFPKSKIILSTWKNSDVSNLQFDDLVTSDDSCPTYRFYKHLSILNNINKQLISTQNGLKIVKTKYAVKVRTDIIFNSNNLLQILSKLNYKTNQDFLNSKILIAYNLSINPKTIKLLFHFNDWFIAGQTHDLKKIFNIPLMSIKDLRFFENKKFNKKIFTFKNWNDNYIKIADLKKNIISRYAPEQYIYKFAVLKNSKLKFDNLFSFNSELLEAHQNFVDREILFKSSSDIGFINLKHKQKFYSDKVGYYTKVQTFSTFPYLKTFFDCIDLEKYFYKTIQLIKILLIKLSYRVYMKLKRIV